jgi:hypothetical protein
MPTTLIPALLLNTLLVLNLIQESEIAADFNDLGKLLLGGFSAAVVVAIGFTFVKIRLRDKKPQTAQFISISNSEREE